LLTKTIYEIYPQANYTLIDISGDMLKIAKERFAGISNFNFLEYNYVEDIPVNNCDLICSALSIHHLNENDKWKLYKNIYSKLDKGGCFINLDQFVAGSGKINNLYNDWWYDYINNSGIKQDEKSAWLERKELDKENTISETIELLRKSGFENIECIYNFMKFGVVMAIK
jgi:ubiquinone/menaquinone biosynthesis C-methylase UbiE